MSALDDRLNTALGASLAGGRLAIGAGIWFAPQPAAQALGFDELGARELVLARLLATRDLGLGAYLVRGLSNQAGLRPAVQVSVVFDAADAIAFGLLAASGGRYARGGRRGAAAAIAAVGLGAWLNRRLAPGYI